MVAIQLAAVRAKLILVQQRLSVALGISFVTFSCWENPKAKLIQHMRKGFVECSDKIRSSGKEKEITL